MEVYGAVQQCDPVKKFKTVSKKRAIMLYWPILEREVINKNLIKELCKKNISASYSDGMELPPSSNEKSSTQFRLISVSDPLCLSISVTLWYNFSISGVLLEPPLRLS